MMAWLLLIALAGGVVGGWVYGGFKLTVGWRAILIGTVLLVVFLVGAVLTGFSG